MYNTHFVFNKERKSSILNKPTANKFTYMRH